MNPLPPLIEELASAQDNSERALWLLSCPAAILITYSSTIRNRLMTAGFKDGVAYLECELTRYRSVRGNGEFELPNPMLETMMAALYGWEGLPVHPAESPTDL